MTASWKRLEIASTEARNLLGPEAFSISSDGAWSYKEYFENISSSIPNIDLTFGKARGSGRWESNRYVVNIYANVDKKEDIYRLIIIFQSKIGVVGNNSLIFLPNDIGGVFARLMHILRWIADGKNVKKKKIYYHPHFEPKINFKIIDIEEEKFFEPLGGSDVNDCIAVLLEEAKKTGEDQRLMFNKVELIIKPDSDPQTLIDLYHKQ